MHSQTLYVYLVISVPIDFIVLLYPLKCFQTYFILGFLFLSPTAGFCYFTFISHAACNGYKHQQSKMITANRM